MPNPKRPLSRARIPLLLVAGGAFVIGALFMSGWSGVIERAIAQVGEFITPPTATFSRTNTPEKQGDEAKTPAPPRAEHIPEPESVRAIYMSQCAAATDSYRTSLMKLMDETELNAIIIDLKDYSGTVSFPSETAERGGKGCTIADFRAFVEQLHEHRVYVIGRLTVFQDPLYTKAHPQLAVQSKKGGIWKDRKGLSFVDVGAAPFHDYIIALAREAHDLGVDEINFDYIRYPSDGDMNDTVFTHSTNEMPVQLELFFKKLAEAVRAEQLDHMPVLSADLFGMVTTNYDDLNIGQVLERALPYFDYIAPMVYPSHYPSGFRGYKNVNERGYDIVNYSMEIAVKRTVATTTKISALAYERIGTSTPALYAKPAYDKNKLRPWLQDFNYPVAYTPAMVEEQIKATYDAGLDSWMFWDPANKYNSLRPVLKPD